MLRNPNAAQRSYYGESGPANSYSRMPYESLDQVIKHMKRLYNKYKAHPAIRQKAVEITSGIPEDRRTGIANRRDHQAIADAIYDWAKKNVAYVNDPAGVEYLQSPVKTLKYGFGDCDDYTTLAAALMSSIGVPVRFKLSKNNPNNRDAYSHIYLEYEVDGSWYPFDLTLHSQAGQEVSDAMSFGKKSIPLDGCGCEGQNLAGIKSSINSLIPGTISQHMESSPRIIYGIAGTALLTGGYFAYKKFN